VATVYCFRIIPMGFIPSQDIGQINAQTEMAQGLGFQAMVEHQIAVMNVVQSDANVRSVTSSIGLGGGGGAVANGGRMQIELKPRAERTLTADQVIESLRPKLAAIPGVRVFLSNPPVINIGGRPTRAPYQFTLTGGGVLKAVESAASRKSCDAGPQDVSTIFC
jgi:HAE1 family hydrophobic/amphiphilic exporter-1